MSFKEKYINVHAQYIYNKYFEARLYEEKYIKEFADSEIQRMQYIYDYLVIDSKISDHFIFQDEKYVSNMGDVQSYIDYYDLYYRIKRLKSRKKLNDQNLKKSKEYIGKETLDKIRFIVEKSDPNINASKIAYNIWEEFIDNLEDGNIDIVESTYERTEKLRVRKLDNNDNFYKELFYQEKDKLIELEDYFPNNLKKVFNSKEDVDEKHKEMEKDLKLSKASLNAIQTLYLQLYKNEGFLS